MELLVNITPDYINEETSWRLQNRCTDQIVWVQDDHMGKTLCVAPAQYTFTLYDSFGDGLCCECGFGYYSVVYDGSPVKEGGEFEESEATTFGSCDLGA